MSREEIEKTVRIGKLYSKDIPNGGILYSWGGDHHDKHADHLTLIMNARDQVRWREYFPQDSSGDAVAGPGLYLSTNLHDSSSYVATTGGILLQADMPEKMPYIRFNHQPTMRALRADPHPVNMPKLARGGDNVPPILYNYTGTWHCLKTPRGVGFRKFDGRGHDVSFIQDQIPKMTRLAREVLKSQLRDDIKAKLRF